MKSRKAETASEQKGYLASLTSTLAGPKYYERDDVRPPTPKVVSLKQADRLASSFVALAVV